MLLYVISQNAFPEMHNMAMSFLSQMEHWSLLNNVGSEKNHLTSEYVNQFFCTRYFFYDSVDIDLVLFFLGIDISIFFMHIKHTILPLTNDGHLTFLCFSYTSHPLLKFSFPFSSQNGLCAFLLPSGDIHVTFDNLYVGTNSGLNSLQKSTNRILHSYFSNTLPTYVVFLF